ncbi:MAG: hypothetical protein CMO01_15415 [Thalassobius sp.]|nr:hypothetical protein [Thalassovita sp.]|tara:strand:- start:230 stop:646 length:417 start_codon:yes stop_codon:yes gene_type:complete
MLKYIKLSLSALTAFFLFGFAANAQTLVSSTNADFTAVNTEETFVVPPRPVNYSEVRNSIEYPISCRKQGIEGKVLTKIYVGKDGSPMKYEIVKSADQALTEACIEKINAFKFEPARDASGNAVERWVVVPLNFKLSI